MHGRASQLLQFILDHIDLPDYYYAKATERYHSVARWLHDCERFGHLSPDVSLQGSFRYGTVVRPLSPRDEYDIDLTCRVMIAKGSISQSELKSLMGLEVAAYAEAKRFNDRPTERNRCWRLDYADEVNFHIDILPSVPEDTSVVQFITSDGVPSIWAQEAVAITDRRHPHFQERCLYWPSSNPIGLGLWFEHQVEKSLTESFRAEKSIAEVPPSRWKSQLQRVIQLLKRHRDTMFLHEPDLRPISMILTVLAAQAYQPSGNLWEAVAQVAQDMEKYIHATQPRIPNPVNPAEDYADKWTRNPELERNFRRWIGQLKADVGNLPTLLELGTLDRDVLRMFKVGLSYDEIRKLRPSGPSRASSNQRPTIHIPGGAPRPWG